MREDNFERELDAALARYAAVEPRDGLEQRVLANLRVQSAKDNRFDWRRWIAAGFVVASLAVLLIWVGERHSAAVNIQSMMVQHETAKAGGSAYAAAESADLSFEKTRERWQSTQTNGSAKPRRNQQVAQANVNAAPKLAQFPAPEPLTEQEKLLIEFVRQAPEEASLVAQIQTAEFQREADEMKARGSNVEFQQQQHLNVEEN